MIFLVYASISLTYTVIRMYKFMYAPQSLMSPVYLSCLLIMVGEIIGRFLFYATHVRVGL
jgi:DMSO reductase anchor subunit